MARKFRKKNFQNSDSKPGIFVIFAIKEVIGKMNVRRKSKSRLKIRKQFQVLEVCEDFGKVKAHLSLSEPLLQIPTIGI